MKTVGLVLGFGHMGRLHAKRLLARGVQTVCVDGSEACEKALRDSEISDVDFVLVATPASSHFAYVKRALELGKDVFVEKPLATTSADVNALVSLSEKSGKILYAGHSERFNPGFLRFREKFLESVRRGALKKLCFVRRNKGSDRGRDVSAALDIGVHDFELFYELKTAAPNVLWKTVDVRFDFSRNARRTVRRIGAVFEDESGKTWEVSENLDGNLSEEADPIGLEQSEFLEMRTLPKERSAKKMRKLLDGALFAVRVAERYSTSPNSAK